MPRTRISTTVDDALLTRAREAAGAANDATLIDAALEALLARHRKAEIDARFAAYDDQPLSEPDEWGDLASWQRAADAS